MRLDTLVFVVLLAGFVAFEAAFLGAEPDSSADVPATAGAPVAEHTLRFGVYQTDKGSVLHTKFRPVLDALAARLTEVLGSRTHIELVIFPSYAEGRRALVEGRIDMVRFGAASYVMAERLDPELELLAMEVKGGDTRFDGLIVVPADSDVQEIGDLAGRRFAFGDRHSTIGRYLSQARLAEAGVQADDLDTFDYLGRHDLVFKAVELRDFDAGALKESTFHDLNERGQLRVLSRWQVVTKPWLGRRGLPDETVDALRGVLLNLDDAEVLRSLGVSGFAPAAPSDYDDIRVGMDAAAAFEGPGA